MSAAPRLPLHIGDYLKDTPPISRRKWEHHGIYLLLLMVTWSTPGCRLPADDNWISDRMGCDLAEFQALVLPVLASYFKKQRGFWVQKRLAIEASFVLKKSAKQAGNAKARWEKEKTDANALPKESHGNASPATPPATPPATSKPALPIDAVNEALGFDISTILDYGRFTEQVFALQRDGLDLREHVVPVITRMRQEGKLPKNLRGLLYFRPAALDFKAAQPIAADMERAHTAKAREIAQTVPDTDWRTALERYLKDGVWKAPAVGPAPISQGCACPPAVLDAFRTRWEQQGRHPRESLTDGGEVWKPGCAAFPEPLPFWSDNVVNMPRRAAP